MTEKIVKTIKTRISAYKDILCGDYQLSHDEAVVMNAQISELEELLDKIESLKEEP